MRKVKSETLESVSDKKAVLSKPGPLRKSLSPFYLTPTLPYALDCKGKSQKDSFTFFVQCLLLFLLVLYFSGCWILTNKKKSAKQNFWTHTYRIVSTIRSVLFQNLFIKTLAYIRGRLFLRLAYLFQFFFKI